MLFASILRRELFLFGMGGLAGAIAFDAQPTDRRRSGKQHLRNGLGGLLGVASEVGVHGSVPASIWLASRDPARSELQYALSELRSVRSSAS